MNTPADHEAYLRAALHAAADSLQPRGDGLDRIRTRLQRRPRVVAWLLAAGDALRLRAPAVLQVAFYQLSTGFRAAWDRFAPDLAPGKHRSRAQGWLRPLAAMAAVIFIVAAGTYVAIDVSTAVSPSSQSSHPRTGGQPGAGARPPAASPTESPAQPASGSASAPHRTSTSAPATPSASCSAQASPSPNPSASPSDSTSPSPTPTDSSDSTDTSGTDSVSAVRLTAFTKVASRAAATVRQDACAPPATSPPTPAPSTS